MYPYKIRSREIAKDLKSFSVFPEGERKAVFVYLNIKNAAILQNAGADFAGVFQNLMMGYDDILRGGTNLSPLIRIGNDYICGIFFVTGKIDILHIFNDIVIPANTYRRYFNNLLRENGFALKILTTIGISLGKMTTVLTNKTIDANLFFHPAFATAKKLAEAGQRGKIQRIVFTEAIYKNLLPRLLQLNPEYQNWITCAQKREFYYCDLVNTKKWD